MGERVLVTGAAGFIGSHLCAALLERGFSVVGVDSFTDYYPRALKEINLAGLRDDQRFTFIEADLLALDLHALLRDGLPSSAASANGRAFSTIFHLAAQPGVRGSWGQQFDVYVRNNVMATQRLLEAALAAGKPKLVYASSSSVYGDLQEMPLREDMAVAPVSPYGVTKLAGEQLCRLYTVVHGLPTVSLRLFTVYGPRQRPDMAFQRFIRALLEAREIAVYGDGQQTRDFTYVSDVVEAFLLAHEAGADGAVFNVASGTRISVREVLTVMARVTGREPQVRWLPPQPGDVRHTWADTTRARERLRFTPRMNLKSGLAAQWEWWRVSHSDTRLSAEQVGLR